MTLQQELEAQSHEKVGPLVAEAPAGVDEQMHQGPTVCSGRQAAAARRDGTSSFRGGISGCVVFRAAGCTEFSLRSQLGHI